MGWSFFDIGWRLCQQKPFPKLVGLDGNKPTSLWRWDVCAPSQVYVGEGQVFVAAAWKTHILVGDGSFFPRIVWEGCFGPYILNRKPPRKLTRKPEHHPFLQRGPAVSVFGACTVYNIIRSTPTQDSSQHQDYETFLVGNPNLNLHLPLLLVGGSRSKVYNLFQTSPGVWASFFFASLARRWWVLGAGWVLGVAGMLMTTNMLRG